MLRLAWLIWPGPWHLSYVCWGIALLTIPCLGVGHAAPTSEASGLSAPFSGEGPEFDAVRSRPEGLCGPLIRALLGAPHHIGWSFPLACYSLLFWEHCLRWFYVGLLQAAITKYNR